MVALGPPLFTAYGAGLCPRRSVYALNLTCLEAGGAHVEALRGASHHGAHGLDVRGPAARGATVRVGNALAEARALGADVTLGSHGVLLKIIAK